MNKALISLLLVLCWLPCTEELYAQVSPTGAEGIEIVVDKKEDRKLNSYFVLNGGYQSPYMVTAPMIPENTLAGDFIIDDDLRVLVDGYSFGLGVLNKTKSFLEVGLLADYYNNRLAITKAGERSMGPWVTQNAAGSLFTDPFDRDQSRVSEVYTIRATLRLKLPLGPLSLWVGITGGSYTSTIRYTEREEVSFFNSSSKTLIAASYQAGLDLMIRDKKKEDALSISFFADFTSPKLEESVYDLLIPGWDFSVPEGNRVISPVRFGIALGIH